MNGEITGEIERFIQDHIHSIEQLEILLLFAGTPATERSALEVSHRLHRQRHSVSARLEELRGQGLLSASRDKSALYRYASHTRHDTLVEGLARAYGVRKDAVIRMIFAKPPERLRASSNASRIQGQG